MPRILVVSQCLWPEEFRVNQVIADLVASGAEVTALTGQPNYPRGTIYPGYRASAAGCERHPAGYDILRVPIIPRGTGNSASLALNYLSFLLSGMIVGPWLLRGRRFDVVFVYGTSPVIQGFLGIWLGRLKRARVVQWVQDLWPHALSATGHVQSPRILALVDRVVRLMYRWSDLVLGQSRAYESYLADKTGQTPVAYFPNPGEHGSGTGQALAAGEFDLVFAGNLGRAQALDTVLAAANRLRDLRDLRILLYGSGSMEVWLKDEIQRADLSNVVLPGRVPSDEIAAVYGRASALLLTLSDDPMLGKTVPSKLQSYLAAGVPIVAGVSGEAAKIVRASGSGVACAAGDPEALASAIRSLYNMAPSDRAALGASGRRYFESHYSPRLLTQQLLDGLSQLAKGDAVTAFEREGAV